VLASITEEYIPPSKGSFLSLFIALIALSCAAIFIKLSEREIGPRDGCFFGKDSRLSLYWVCF